MSDDEIGFEDQLRLEAEEQARSKDTDSVRTRVDPDGTQYEWDAEKNAWFPKIDADFIAQYQMNYGADNPDKDQEKTDTDFKSKEAPEADPYQNYWSNCDTNSKEYREWYEYYYGQQARSNESTDKNDEKPPTDESTVKDTNENSSDSNSEIPPAPEDTNSKEYYDWYYKYYGDFNVPKEMVSGENTGYSEEYWAQYFHFRGQEVTEENKSDNSNDTSEKDAKSKDDADQGKGKGKKRKPPQPPSWFEMTEDKNTNVYVSGLPIDMTDDEFKDLMNKYGLIMFDPITRKPKLKLYKDESGKNKGDGRCCYIKTESVELALQILDGSEVNGHKIYVERAKFELKGNFDPTKRRRKLTKHEKKKFMMKQEKLFDWRPDKLIGARNRWEKVVILKNVFDPAIFEKDPTQVETLKKKLEIECAKYGDVKKVVVYDRHPEKVAGITFKAAEEADICLEAFNGRLFGSRQLSAALWDGKTKYTVEETDAERDARLKGWAKFLDGDETSAGSAEAKNKSDPVNTSQNVPMETETSGNSSQDIKKESEGDETHTNKDNGDKTHSPSKNVPVNPDSTDNAVENFPSDIKTDTKISGSCGETPHSNKDNDDKTHSPIKNVTVNPDSTDNDDENTSLDTKTNTKTPGPSDERPHSNKDNGDKPHSPSKNIPVPDSTDNAVKNTPLASSDDMRVNSSTIDDQKSAETSDSGEQEPMNVEEETHESQNVPVSDSAGGDEKNTPSASTNDIQVNPGTSDDQKLTETASAGEQESMNVSPVEESVPDDAAASGSTSS